MKDSPDATRGRSASASTRRASFYNDLLILGSVVPEGLPSAPGDIRAFDVRTGKARWSFHTIPHPGEFGYDTWPKDAWTYLGGANAWSGVSLDEQRGLVFAATGSTSYDFYGANRLGDNLFANSIFACAPRRASGSGTSRPSNTICGIEIFQHRPCSSRSRKTASAATSSRRSRRTAAPTCSTARPASRCFRWRRSRSLPRTFLVNTPPRSSCFRRCRRPSRDSRSRKTSSPRAQQPPSKPSASSGSVCAREASTSLQACRARSCFPAWMVAASGAAPRTIPRPASSMSTRTRWPGSSSSRNGRCPKAAGRLASRSTRGTAPRATRPTSAGSLRSFPRSWISRAAAAWTKSQALCTRGQAGCRRLRSFTEPLDARSSAT